MARPETCFSSQGWCGTTAARRWVELSLPVRRWRVGSQKGFFKTLFQFNSGAGASTSTAKQARLERSGR